MVTALQARVGRERQRYADNFRLVAGCIPYRLKLNVEKNHTGDYLDDLEVLMISTPNRHDLVFPKGGWEDDEDVHQAARREALEEAGVTGIIDKTELGVWEFRSKSRQNSCGQEGACRGYMFALRVTEQLESWPEQDTHNRRWVSVIEAMRLCRYEWMREALKAFLHHLFPFTLSNVLEPSPHFCYTKPSEAEGWIMPSMLFVDNSLSQALDNTRVEKPLTKCSVVVDFRLRSDDEGQASVLVQH